MNNKSRRVKSSGWAAFDLKQRQKDGEGDGKDPFPAIGDLPVTGGLRRNNDVGGLSFKSFSSVLQPPASPGFPAVKTPMYNISFQDLVLYYGNNWFILYWQPHL